MDTLPTRHYSLYRLLNDLMINLTAEADLKLLLNSWAQDGAGAASS